MKYTGSNTLSGCDVMRKKRRILIVDGYNLIGANKELVSESKVSLELAREELITALAEYQMVTTFDIMTVSDAYEEKRMEAIVQKQSINSMFTKEKETT